MNFKNFFNMLSKQEQNVFALESGTTSTYIKKFMLSDNEKYKRMASKDMMARLIAASGGRLGWIDLVLWFYPEIVGPPPQELIDKAHDRSKTTGDQDQSGKNEIAGDPPHALSDDGPRDQSEPTDGDNYGL